MRANSTRDRSPDIQHFSLKVPLAVFCIRVVICVFIKHTSLQMDRILLQMLDIIPSFSPLKRNYTTRLVIQKSFMSIWVIIHKKPYLKKEATYEFPYCLRLNTFFLFRFFSVPGKQAPGSSLLSRLYPSLLARYSTITSALPSNWYCIQRRFIRRG